MDRNAVILYKDRLGFQQKYAVGPKKKAGRRTGPPREAIPMGKDYGLGLVPVRYEPLPETTAEHTAPVGQIRFELLPLT